MPEPAGTDRTTDRTQAQAASIGSNGDETHPASANPSAPGFAPPAEPGDVGKLGPYRVLKELGKGGMGAVYLALDTRLNRRLALKVMLPAFAANAAAKERFLREARAAAQISHDNVVTVYEADERDGVPYIAMQLLQGYPLDEYLRKKGDLPIAHVLRIGRETAAGLAAAHRTGLVHRDVKPGNLWLEAPNGRVKVLDFGLARPVDAEAELTKSGAIIGTPAYMSPEQARGERVDARTDLFSLGGVLYRLCTGKLPFEGPSTMAVLMALGTAEPRPVRELNPAVPEPLAELIHRLLAKDPEARPRTADEVVKALRGVTEGLAVPTALPVGPGPLPQVVAAPIHVTAQPEYNAFADLDATEAEPEAQAARPAAAEAVRKKEGGKGRWVAVGLAALAVAVLGGVIIVIGNKDGSGTKIEVPDGAAVTVKGKDGKTLAQVKPDGGKPALDPDRKAAEYVLSIGGGVRVNGEDRVTKAVAELPKPPYALTGILLTDNVAVTDAGLTHVRGCKSLTHLDLGGTGVTDAGLAHFEGSTGLTLLYLSRTRATDAGLAHFKGCTGLTVLDLHGTAVTDAALAHFEGCKGLTALQLNETKVTDAGLAHFEGCKALTGLFLNNTAVADAGLAHFKGCKRLTGLYLNNTAVTDAGLSHFRDCTGLTELAVGGTAVTDASLGTLAGFADLTVLDVRKAKLTPDGVKKLAAALPKCGIEHDGGTVEPTDVDRKAAEWVLSVGGKVWANGGGPDIEGVQKLPKSGFVLTHVNLIGKRVMDADLDQLRWCGGLTVLHLEDSDVTDAGLRRVKTFASLKTLGLSGTAVTDVGLIHIGECRGLSLLLVARTKVTVKGLGDFQAAMPGCRVEHDGGAAGPKPADDHKAAEFVLSLGGFVWVNGQAKDIKATADLPKGPFALTHVNLNGTQTGDGDLTPLKDCPLLVSVALDHTRVTDAGLASLKDCKGLTRLWLLNTGVTDASLDTLAGFDNLTGLDVRGTRLTPAAVKKLAAALPKCKIEHGGGTAEPKK